MDSSVTFLLIVAIAAVGGELSISCNSSFLWNKHEIKTLWFIQLQARFGVIATADPSSDNVTLNEKCTARCSSTKSEGGIVKQWIRITFPQSCQNELEETYFCEFGYHETSSDSELILWKSRNFTFSPRTCHQWFSHEEDMEVMVTCQTFTKTSYVLVGVVVGLGIGVAIFIVLCISFRRRYFSPPQRY